MLIAGFLIFLVFFQIFLFLHPTYPQKLVQKHVVVNIQVVTQRVQISVSNDNMSTNNMSIGYYLPQNIIVSKKSIVSNNVIIFWK